MFRHGLRVSETCRLKLDQVDADSRVLHVIRLKHGLSTDHPLRADELRAIAAWLRERDRMKLPAAVKTFFVSEQRKPLHRSTVNLLLDKYSAASLPLHAHPHMLRHACGYALADQGADTRLIQGLPRTPQHPAHRPVYGQQSGAIPAALAVISPTDFKSLSIATLIGNCSAGHCAQIKIYAQSPDVAKRLGFGTGFLDYSPPRRFPVVAKRQHTPSFPEHNFLTCCLGAKMAP